MRISTLVAVGAGACTLSLFLVGCAMAPIPAGTPTADLSLAPDAQGRTEMLFTPKDASCESILGQRFVAHQGMLWDNTNKPVPIPANQRFYIRASITTSIGLHQTSDCDNIVSFVPEQGHTYQVSQTVDNALRTCHTYVRDAAGGSQPATYLAHPVPKGGCLKAPSSDKK